MLCLGHSKGDLTTTKVPIWARYYVAFYRGVAAAVRGEAAVPVDPRESLVVRIIERIHREFSAA